MKAFKTCKDCTTEKPITEFIRNSRSKDGRDCRCKICYRAYRKRVCGDWQKKKNERYRSDPANREKIKAYGRKYAASIKGRMKVKEKGLRTRYGISLSEYYSMLEAREYKCDICKLHQKEIKVALCVDHDHKTNKVRGILCDACNRGIGFLKENNQNLLSAIDYLSRTKDEVI